MTGYEFKCSLHLHAKETVHRDNIWGEGATLPEASLQVLTLFFFPHHQEALLWRLFTVGEGVSVHDTHVMNTVCTSLPEVVDKQI